MELLRGVVEGIDSGPSSRVDVRLDRDPTALLAGITVLGNIYMDWVAAGTRVIVAVFDDNEALVVGLVKNPTQLLISGWGFKTTPTHTVTSTNWATYAALAAAFTVSAPVFCFVFFAAAGSNDTIRATALGMRLNMQGYGYSNERVIGQGVANTEQSMVFYYRKWVVAGAYSWTMQFRLKNAGDTFSLPESSLTVLTVPT